MLAVEPTPLARSSAPVTEQVSDCVVFTLGERTYAVASAVVRDCLSLPRLTPLDDTPDYLMGAFDLRGELVPVVSPSRLGGEHLKLASSGDLVVVLDVLAFPLALHADAVLGVERVREALSTKVATIWPAIQGQIELCGGRAWLINPLAIRLVARVTERSWLGADARLAAFEGALDADGLALLELRAERYRHLSQARA